jgi:hypothetical protein
VKAAPELLKARSPKAGPPQVRPFTEFFQQQIFGYTPPSTGGLLKLYQTSPPARLIVHRIAASTARPDFYIDGQYKIDTTHPFLDFIEDGGPFLTGFQSRLLLQVYLDLVGRCPVVIGRQNGVPVSWMPIPPIWVTQHAFKPGERWLISPTNGSPVWIPFDDLIMFKDVNPEDPIRDGASTTRAVALELELDKAVSEHVYNVLRNRARPDVLITGTENNALSETDVNSLEQLWRAKFGGTNKAGKPGFSKAPLQVIQFGATLKDTQVAELKKLQWAILSQAYGVPPEILGNIENANRSTIDQADTLFGKYCIEPRLINQCKTWERWARAEWSDIKRRSLLFVSPIDKNNQHNLNTMSAAPWAFNQNEWRALAGMKPVPKGDTVFPPMDRGQGDKAGSEEAGGDGKKPADRSGAQPKKKPGGKKAIGDLTLDDLMAISGAIDEPETKSECRMLLLAAMKSALGEAFDDVVDALGGDVEFPAAVLDSHAQKIAGEAIEQINETTRAAIIAVLMSGAKASLDELLASIGETFEKATNSRAGVIGTTEATQLGGVAGMEAMKLVGVETKTWITAGDERVRATHSALHGQTVKMSEPFVAPGGYAAMAPGGFGVAALDANCRCISIPGGEKDQAAYEAAMIKFYDAAAVALKEAVVEVFDVQKQAVQSAARKRKV